MSPIIWALIAVVLVIIEALVVDFTFLMIAAGALAGVVTALATDALAPQIVVAAIVAVLGLIFVRPYFRNYFSKDKQLESNVYALEGKNANTLTRVTSDAGQVKINGEVWSARALDGEIPVNTQVRVVSVHGATLIVSPASA
ncbi:membrane protein implicated in regulation of membrane protease activity [Arcanobacterium wilhelmae]|uniref:Membrane protein implicated in regulation of membrane protease activity n=1 Tax=Arcanobacterium wilhelmae TaxID=1803177 RepID=A0ABT9N8B9_9ACTO|nr:NfeD family protein [Arcanobacterium wilhelmae]MDP9799952.1 membrane protein implicated in regulation of membrane protease activity [Arcanobacterium wilhelmae]WFN91086.1 NfeD family protein [Arcanobacterium wilhelmae]